MFNLNIFNKISSEVLTIKNDLELNSENQLITKYKTSALLQIVGGDKLIIPFC